MTDHAHELRRYSRKIAHPADEDGLKAEFKEAAKDD